MSRKHDKKGRSKGEARYVKLHHWLLESAAWHDLTCYARCALVLLYQKYNGLNNGDVGMSVRELAASLRCGLDTAHRATKQLVAHGFIVEHVKGDFDWKTKHNDKPTGRSTRWLLTEFPFEGDLPTKDFTRWTTGQSVPVAEHQMQNAVPVAERSVPVAERSVPVAERYPLKNGQSVPVAEPFRAKSASKCTSSRTCISYQVRDTSGASDAAPPGLGRQRSRMPRS